MNDLERSPKAYCKKHPYEKTACVTKTAYNHYVYKTGNGHHFLISNTLYLIKCRPICHLPLLLLFSFSSSSFAYSLRMWA